MGHLLQLVSPISGESYAGFLLRLADANFYTTPMYLYRKVTGGRSRMNPNIMEDTTAISRLCTLAVVDPREILRMGFVKEKNGLYATTNNQFVNRYMIHTQGTKICPLCLAENVHMRNWDLSLVTTCPEHKILLIDHCPKCGKRISWLRHKLTMCECGCDLRYIDTINVSEKENALSKLITNLAQGISNIEIYSYLPLPLKKLDIMGLSRVVVFITGQYMGINDATGKVIGTTPDNSQLHRILNKAMDIFDDWPGRYYNFLDYLRQNQHVRSIRDTGINKDFGRFYEILYTEFKDNQFDFLREAFEEYLAEWDGGYITKKNRVKQVEQKLISETMVARNLSIRSSRVKELVELGHLSGIIRKHGSRSLVLVDPESVKNYLSKVDNGYTLSQASSILGIGRHAVIDIIKHKCIKPMSGPIVDKSSIWLIHRKSIEELLAKLECISKGSNLPQINFGQVVRKISVKGYTIGSIVKKTLEGNLIVTGIDREAKGLQRLLYAKAHVEMIIYDKSEVEEAPLTVLGVSRKLNLKQEVVSFYIDQGFIKATIVSGSKVKRLVKKNEIDEFRKKYTPASHLAEQQGLTSRALIEQLIHKKIYPISGPSIDGGRQYLFKNTDLSDIYNY